MLEIPHRLEIRTLRKQRQNILLISTKALQDNIYESQEKKMYTLRKDVDHLTLSSL